MPRPDDILELTVAELRSVVRKAKRQGKAEVLTGLKSVAALNGSAASLLKGTWDESKHDRAADGKFGSGFDSHRAKVAAHLTATKTKPGGATPRDVARAAGVTPEEANDALGHLHRTGWQPGQEPPAPPPAAVAPGRPAPPPAEFHPERIKEAVKGLAGNLRAIVNRAGELPDAAAKIDRWRRRAAAAVKAEYAIDLGRLERQVEADFGPAALRSEEFARLREAFAVAPKVIANQIEIMADSAAELAAGTAADPQDARDDIRARPTVIQDIAKREQDAIDHALIAVLRKHGAKEKGYALDRYFKSWSEAGHHRDHGKFAHVDPLPSRFGAPESNNDQTDDTPDPHAALWEAALAAVADAREAGDEAAVAGLVASYRAHLDDGDLLAGATADPAAVVKSVRAVLRKAFDESKHKRDHGKFAKQAGGGEHGPVEIAAQNHLAAHARRGNRAAAKGDAKGVAAHAKRHAALIQQAYKNEWKHIQAAVAAKYGPEAAADPGMAEVRKELAAGQSAALSSLMDIQLAHHRLSDRGVTNARSTGFDHSDELAAARTHQMGAGEKAYAALARVLAKYQPLHKSYDESKHPRGRDGRYIGKDAIHAAASDPAKADALRAQVKPEDAGKLEAALKDPASIGHTKRGQQKHEAHTRREKKRADHARAQELADRVSTGEASYEELQELGDHLEGLTADALRSLQSRIPTEGNGRRKAEMVAALRASLDEHRHAVHGKELGADDEKLGRLREAVSRLVADGASDADVMAMLGNGPGRESVAGVLGEVRGAAATPATVGESPAVPEPEPMPVAAEPPQARPISVGDALKYTGRGANPDEAVEFRGYHTSPDTGKKMARVIFRPKSGPPFETSVDAADIGHADPVAGKRPAPAGEKVDAPTPGGSAPPPAPPANWRDELKGKPRWQAVDVLRQREPHELTRDEYHNLKTYDHDDAGSSDPTFRATGLSGGGENIKRQEKEQYERHLGKQWEDSRDAAFIAGKPVSAKPEWATPQGEYVRTSGNDVDDHRAAVGSALAANKPVPPEVLADYPDLTPKAVAPPPATPAAPAGKPPRAAKPKPTPAWLAASPAHAAVADHYGRATGKAKDVMTTALDNAEWLARDPRTDAVTGFVTAHEEPDAALPRAAGSLATGHRHLAESGGTPEELAHVESALAAAGAEKVGEPGATVPFDGSVHEHVPGLFTGDPVRVAHAGWRVGTDAPVKAKVEPTGAKAGGGAAGKPTGGGAAMPAFPDNPSRSLPEIDAGPGLPELPDPGEVRQGEVPELEQQPVPTAAPRAKRPIDPDRPKVEYVRAPAGGQVSDVDGRHYAGGQLMPTHGLYAGQPKAPKGNGVGTGDPVTPNEDAEGGSRRQPARALTPDEIAARHERAADQKKWDEMNAGPMGRVAWLGNSPNQKGMVSGTELKKWREHAESIGPEGVNHIISTLEPEYHAFIDSHFAKRRAENQAKKDAGQWNPTYDREVAEDEGQWDKDHLKTRGEEAISMFSGSKKHEKKVPGSHYARELVHEMLSPQNNPPGMSKIDIMHRMNGILSGKPGASVGDPPPPKAPAGPSPAPPTPDEKRQAWDDHHEAERRLREANEPQHPGGGIDDRGEPYDAASDKLERMRDWAADKPGSLAAEGAVGRAAERKRRAMKAVRKKPPA